MPLKNMAMNLMHEWVLKPFKNYLRQLILEEEIQKLREELPTTNSETKIKKITKAFKIIEAFS